jgi:hypothetical protein
LSDCQGSVPFDNPKFDVVGAATASKQILTLALAAEGSGENLV